MYNVRIAEDLYDVYPEIWLGCLHFQVKVQQANEEFWNYMDTQVLPEVRTKIYGKEWSEIPGVKGSRAAYKAFGRNPGRCRYRGMEPVKAIENRRELNVLMRSAFRGYRRRKRYV